MGKTRTGLPVIQGNTVLGNPNSYNAPPTPLTVEELTEMGIGGGGYTTTSFTANFSEETQTMESGYYQYDITTSGLEDTVDFYLPSSDLYAGQRVLLNVTVTNANDVLRIYSSAAIYHKLQTVNHLRFGSGGGTKVLVEWDAVQSRWEVLQATNEVVWYNTDPVAKLFNCNTDQEKAIIYLTDSHSTSWIDIYGVNNQFDMSGTTGDLTISLASPQYLPYISRVQNSGGGKTLTLSQDSLMTTGGKRVDILLGPYKWIEVTWRKDMYIITTASNGIFLAGNYNGEIILPTDDPHIEGALWNNSGTITVSDGP